MGRWRMITTKGKQMKEKREGKRRMMQTQLLATTPPRLLYCFLLFFYVRLPRSFFLVFLYLSVSPTACSSSFSDAEKARSRPLSRSLVLFGQFLVLYQVAAWNAGVLRSLRAASNR